MERGEIERQNWQAIRDALDPDTAQIIRTLESIGKLDAIMAIFDTGQLAGWGRLSMDLAMLELDTRLVGELNHHGIVTLMDLVSTDTARLTRMVGLESFSIIHEFLEVYGFPRRKHT